MFWDGQYLSFDRVFKWGGGGGASPNYKQIRQNTFTSKLRFFFIHFKIFGLQLIAIVSANQYDVVQCMYYFFTIDEQL